MDKLFLSEDNYASIYDIIQELVQEKFRMTIDQKYADRLIRKSIEYIWNNVNHFPPKNMNPEKYLDKLNIKVFDLIMPLIEKHVNEVRPKQLQPPPRPLERNIPMKTRTDPPPQPIENRQMDVMSRFRELPQPPAIQKSEQMSAFPRPHLPPTQPSAQPPTQFPQQLPEQPPVSLSNLQDPKRDRPQIVINRDIQQQQQQQTQTLPLPSIDQIISDRNKDIAPIPANSIEKEEQLLQPPSPQPSSNLMLPSPQPSSNLTLPSPQLSSNLMLPSPQPSSNLMLPSPQPLILTNALKLSYTQQQIIHERRVKVSNGIVCYIPQYQSGYMTIPKTLHFLKVILPITKNDTMNQSLISIRINNADFQSTYIEEYRNATQIFYKPLYEHTYSSATDEQTLHIHIYNDLGIEIQTDRERIQIYRIKQLEKGKSQIILDSGEEIPAGTKITIHSHFFI
jgi:hypothetical protein